MGSVAAGGCLTFSVILSLGAAVVMLVGLAGMQAACTDITDLSLSESAEVSAGWSTGEAGGAAAGGGAGSGSGAAHATNATAPPPEWAGGNLADLSGTVQNITELVKNITQATLNTTQSALNNFLSKMARSDGFVACARTYSLHWWAWVCQVMLVLASSVSLCSGRCMRAVGHPLLLFTATVVVLDMVVCNGLVETYSYEGSGLSSWANVTLAGFVLACAANYLFLFSAPALLRAREETRRRRGAEERRPLAISVEEVLTA